MIIENLLQDNEPSNIISSGINEMSLSGIHKDCPTKKEVTCSYFLKPITNTLPYKHITLNNVVVSIKGDRAKKVTEKLRAIVDVDEAKQYKAKHFDYATFSGTFEKRNNASLIMYSGLIALDFDHVKNVEDIKTILLNQRDVDTVLVFVSTSGDGIKWIVPSTNKDEHEQVFRMYQRYCKDTFDLVVDESGKDIARACFIPYDENVVYNEKFEFRKLEKYWGDSQSKDPILYTTSNPAMSNTRQFDSLSPFDDYSANGDVITLLEAHGWRFDKKSSTDTNIRFTRPGKNGGVSADLRKADKIFFVFTDSSGFEASKGYNASQVFTLLECGGDFKVAHKKLLALGYGDSTTQSAPQPTFSEPSRSVEKNSDALNFYTDDFKISASGVAAFNKQMGFIRISEQGNDSITIIKNDNKILNAFNHRTDTISFLKQHINHPKEKTRIENLLVSKKNLILISWELMEGEPYNLHRDTKDAIYIPFRNGVCKITKEGIEMIDYKSKEIDFFIETESQKHIFEMRDIAKRGIGDFEKFIIYAIIGKQTDEITEGEKEAISAFYSMIGYLISNYKNSAESPAIILSDEGADDQARKGARGKSLLTNAMRKVRGSKFRDGAKFETGYRHVYADLEKYDDIYVLDDVTHNFNYDALYTDITGDITAERKGTQAVTIPFKDAPKFVVTTNWAVRYDKAADSTNRRFVEYKFSYFWNSEHTPEKFFGYRFFDDWNHEQWQLFYELLIVCAMQFLETGLKRISYSKDDDNYRAYFSNDAVLEEFERIYRIMKTKDSFSVMEFLREHQNNPIFRSTKKFFNHINSRDRIDAYILKHKHDVKYNQTNKRWYFMQNEINPF